MVNDIYVHKNEYSKYKYYSYPLIQLLQKCDIICSLLIGFHVVGLVFMNAKKKKKSEIYDNNFIKPERTELIKMYQY